MRLFVVNRLTALFIIEHYYYTFSFHNSCYIRQYMEYLLQIYKLQKIFKRLFLDM